jgi:kinesin family protein 15
MYHFCMFVVFFARSLGLGFRLGCWLTALTSLASLTTTRTRNNCRVGLQLREDVKRGVTVRDLKELTVETAEEAAEILKVGGRNRRVATTSMNRESSRSHAVFTMIIKTLEINDDVTNVKEARLNLIDLAGSERQRSTDAAGDRLKEAGAINKSLSALGNVIMALGDIENGKQRHVAYRDSKLTFLLRDSLGGNTKTFMVANIGPAAKSFGETLSTLQFAKRAKMIKNSAKINEDVSGNVAALQRQIRELKLQLASSANEPATQLALDANGTTSTGSSDQMSKLVMGAFSSRDAAERQKVLLEERLEASDALVLRPCYVSWCCCRCWLACSETDVVGSTADWHRPQWQVWRTRGETRLVRINTDWCE